MKTLRIKLLAAALVLVLVCQAVTVTAVLLQAHGDAKARAVHSLTVTSGVLRSYLASRHQQLATTVDILASDFAFRKAVATRDTSTLQSALRNHASRVGAAYAVIYGPDGEVVSATSDSAPLLDQATVLAVERRRRQRVVDRTGRRDLPVGARVDARASADRLGRNGFPHRRRARDAVQGHYRRRRQLRGRRRRSTREWPRRRCRGRERDQLVGHLTSGPIGDDAMPGYVLQSELLSASGMPVLAVLLRPRTEAMAVFNALAKSMLVLGALSAAIAIGTAVVSVGLADRTAGGTGQRGAPHSRRRLLDADSGRIDRRNR